MRIIWIYLCVALIIAFVEAQKNLKLAKPVIALEKRSGPPIWRRAPEERKKLSLFPKNSKKFVVTEKTTPRTEVTKSMVTTKRPMLRKLFVKDNIDRKTWTFAPRETTMKPKQFNVPVTPHPKRDYNRSYKAKAHDQKAQPSSIKTVATSVKAEPPTNKAKLNRGNLIQVLNKINAYTNKAATNKAKKVIQNNDPAKVKSAFKLFKKPTYVNAGTIKENTPAPKLNEEVKKVEEKIFMSKPMDYDMQDNKPLNVSSLDTISEEYEDENDYESKEANVTKKNNDEQLNKADEKALLSNQVDKVTQNNKPLNYSSLNIVSEEYVDDNDNENSEINMTKKTNNEQVNKMTEKTLLSKQMDNNKSFNASSFDIVSKEYVGEIDHESNEKNVTKATTNEQLNKAAEKILSSKPVDSVIQNDKSLNASSLDIISEEYVDDNDNEISEANVKKATTNEQLNKTAEEISLKKQVDKVIQNDKILNAILLDIVSEKHVDENDYESSEVNITKSIANEQPNRTAEKLSLSKQVDNVIQNDKSFHASLLDIVSKKYVHGNDYESREANEYNTITDDQLNKTADKISLSKQVDDVMQNNNLLNASVPDTVLEEYIDENYYENSESNLTQTPVNEEINKTAEKISLSKQVDNAIQNNKSLNSSLPDTVLEEFINENYYERSETNLTQTTVNEEINKIGIEVFSSKQINNISQNNDSLKVNIANEYVVNESDSRASHVTPPELLYEENESTTIHTIFTEKLFNHNEPLEGITLERNNLNDQNDFSISKLNDTLSSDDESGDLSKLKKLETLIKEIAKGTNSDKDHELLVNSNDPKPKGLGSLKSVIQDINKENIKIQPQKFEEISNNYYEVEPIDFDSENKISTQIEVTKKYEGGNIEIKKDQTKTESNTSNTNNVINDLENLFVVIKGSTTSSENKANIIDSKLSKLDSNIVVEYSDKSDTISAEYDQTSPVSYIYERLPKSPIEATFDNLQMLSDCLTKSPIEIAFDNLKTLGVEEKSEEPVLITSGSIIIDQITENPITENVISMNNYFVTRIPEDNEDRDTDIFSGIMSLNIEEKINHNNENGSITDNLRDLAEIIKDKSTDDSGSEKAISVTQLMELDINIVEEHSHIPEEITTELGRTTQAFHFNNGPSTKIPIELVFDSQEALITEKNSTKPAFNENEHKIMDQSLIHGLIKRDEIISIINDPTTDISINIEDSTTNAVSPIEILDIEQSSSENNENRPIVITLPNLDEILNNNLIVGDDIEVFTSGTDPLNSYINIANDNIDKLHAVTVAFDGNLDTKQDDVGFDHENATSTRILYNDREPYSADLIFDVYTNKITDEPVTEQLNFTEEVTTNVEDSLRNITPKAEDTNTISQTDSPSKVAIPLTQLITFHINTEENSDKPNMITIVLDGTTQKTYLNCEHSDHAPIGIFLDNLEPIIPKKKDLNMPIDEIINESVTNQPSTNLENIEITEDSVKVTNKHIFDEFLGKSSNLPDDNLSKSNNFKAKGVLSELNIASEEISSEPNMDNFINSSDEFSHESLIATKGSSGSLEEMFEIMIAQADRSKYEADENSNESYVFNDSSSSLVIQEDISDEIIADHTKNLSDNISSDSHVSNESITSLITTEEMSDEITADKSKNINDEISSESYIVNDSSNSVMTTEEIFDDITREASENLPDEISNESRILNDSSSTEVIIQDIFDDMADEKSESLTYEVLNESHLELIHTSDEKSLEFEQTKNLTGEDGSNDYDIDVRHSNTELAPIDMLVRRIKRSNNIIEEENLATTLSSFKYTGQGNLLGHDPRYKNINA